MAAPAWAQTGYDNIPKNEGGGGKSTRRFWLPHQGSEMERTAIVTFVDGDAHDKEGNKIPEAGPFCIYEHDIGNINGKWGTYRTCVKGLSLPDAPNCPYCEVKCPRYYIGFYTLIDEREKKWTPQGSDKEEVRQNQKLLIGVKSQQLPFFAKQDRLRTGLSGTRWEVTRSGKKASRVGDAWAYIHDIEIKEVYEQKVWLPDGVKFEDYYLKGFNYAEILAPVSAGQMKQEAGTGSGEGVKDGTGDEIPFN